MVMSQAFKATGELSPPVPFSYPHHSISSAENWTVKAVIVFYTERCSLEQTIKFDPAIGTRKEVNEKQSNI